MNNTVVITLSLILVGFSSIAQGETCSWPSDLEHSSQLQADGELRLALEYLQAQYRRCPELSRLPLEIGSLHEKLGETDTASEVWQAALNEHVYPEAVRVNVQLRILALRATVPPHQDRLTLRGGARFFSKVNDTAVESLVVWTRTTAPTLSPNYEQRWRYELSGLNQQFLRSDVQQGLLRFSVQHSLKNRYFTHDAWLTGLLRNGEPNVETVTRPAFQYNKTRFELPITLQWVSPSLEISPKISSNGTLKPFLSTDFILKNSVWEWREIQTGIRWGHTFSPAVQLDYNLASSRIDSSLGATATLTPSLLLNAQWKALWQPVQPEHQFSASITWRALP